MEGNSSGVCLLPQIRSYRWQSQQMFFPTSSQIFYQTPPVPTAHVASCLTSSQASPSRGHSALWLQVRRFLSSFLQCCCFYIEQSPVPQTFSFCCLCFEPLATPSPPFLKSRVRPRAPPHKTRYQSRRVTCPAQHSVLLFPRPTLLFALFAAYLTQIQLVICIDLQLFTAVLLPKQIVLICAVLVIFPQT